MDYNLHHFQEDLDELNISINDEQRTQFLKYYELLVEWNEKMNLTAITEFDEVLKKHFVDSISLLSYYDFSSVKKIIDVGTGAGFPGIPLKIMLPDVEFVLMDSLNKRITFLSEVIKELGLEKISVIHSRAEDLANDGQHREAYDLCVSRAVANMSTLSEYCLPFVKPSGNFIPYKSGEIKEELKAASNAISVLGGKLVKTESFNLPHSDIGRSFVVVKKEKNTPKKYPRKGALPKNKPL